MGKKFRTTIIYTNSKKNHETLGYRSKQNIQDLYAEKYFFFSSDERNQRRYREMEWHVFVDWKPHHSKHVSLCNSYQDPNKIFIDVEKITLKLIWNSRGAWIAETILKKKNKKSQSTWFQDLLYRNQDFMVSTERWHVGQWRE